MGHLGPSYGMDFDRDYSSYNLNNISTNSTGMNDISALAAAASDQLYELERHEAFRRAEFEMRHRQIASARKSNGNSPSATPLPSTNERDKYGLNGINTPEGGRVVYPISAAQGASGNQPAVPSGTLADPTYLVPPTCCHEECHKSYRKRLKYAKATQACPNCLSQPGQSHSNHHGGGHGQGGQGGGGGGGSGHHSSGSNTPKDRTGGNSSEDLTKLAGGGGQGGNGNGGSNNYNFHQASLHTQLAKLQQQHLAALQQARSRRTSHPSQSQSQAQNQSHGHGHGGLARPGQGQSHGHGYGGFSTNPSTGPSPASSDSEDDDEPVQHQPVTHGMNKMSLFHHRTAPSSPAHSRGPSRAGSPVEGHSANSGKHGLGSHSARDAKHRSHPYSHPHSNSHSNSGVNINQNHAHFSVPSSPHLHPHSKHRMSPPDLARSLSGGGGLPRQSVEDILNSSAIPPPPSHSDRMLPPPNSTSYNSTAPSLSYSLSNSGSAVQSPSTSRASSPTTHSHHGHQHGHGHGHHSHHSSNLAHSVRNAFNMTPISANSSPSASGTGKATSPPIAHKLAPMSMSGSGHGMNIGVGQQQQSLAHQSQLNQIQQMQAQAHAARSRGNSPVHGHGHGHGHHGGGGGGGGGGMKMEVDGQA
jgi:zinc finger protein CreA/MIG